MLKVAVIGLGRFGMALAENLAKEGIEVIAIDNDPNVINDVKDRVALAVSALVYVALSLARPAPPA